MKPTSQQIRSWMNRQRTRPTPNKNYLNWLRKQFTVVCLAEVKKGKK